MLYSLQYFGRERGTIGTNLSYNHKIITFTLWLATITRGTDGP